MKKFTMLIAVVAMMFFITMPVMAGSPYVSLKGSMGTTNTGDIKLSHIPEGLVNATDTGSSETVKSPGMAIGYDTGAVRIEFEYFNRGKVDHNTSIGGGYTVDGEYIPIIDIANEVMEEFWYMPIMINSFNINTKVDTETFFLNAYMESDTIFGYTLLKNLEYYLGGGVGMAKHKSKVNYNVGYSDYQDEYGPTNHTVSFSDRDSNSCVAFNLQLGAAYLITDNIAIDLGLRYADLGQAQLGSNLEADSMIVKEAVLAFRYTF